MFCGGAVCCGAARGGGMCKGVSVTVVGVVHWVMVCVLSYVVLFVIVVYAWS